jgi:hypothetical protein
MEALICQRPPFSSLFHLNSASLHIIFCNGLIVSCKVEGKFPHKVNLPKERLHSLFVVRRWELRNFLDSLRVNIDAIFRNNVTQEFSLIYTKYGLLWVQRYSILPTSFKNMS